MATPGVASAQQTASSDAEFRWVHGLNSMAFMMQSPLPTQVPTGPVEVVEWRFYREPLDLPPLGRHDSTASRTRIDCRVGTMENLSYAAYLADTFIREVDGTGWVQSPSPGSAGSELIRMVCEPGYGEGPRTYVDFSAARAAVQAHFEGRAD